jgi:hypothetical protein
MDPGSGFLNKNLVRILKNIPTKRTIPCPSLLSPAPSNLKNFSLGIPLVVWFDEVWSTAIFGSHSFYLSKKLKHTKKTLKHWNKYFFGDICTKLDSTLYLLDVTQQAPSSDSNLAFELHLKSVINEYLEQEESM